VNNYSTYFLFLIVIWLIEILLSSTCQKLIEGFECDQETMRHFDFDAPCNVTIISLIYKNIIS